MGIDQNPCRHRVRFSLSDASGELVFTDFAVIDRPDCTVVKAIQEHLVGRALDKVDWGLIEQLGQRGACTCADDIVAVLEEFQEQFSRRRARAHESGERH